MNIRLAQDNYYFKALVKPRHCKRDLDWFEFFKSIYLFHWKYNKEQLNFRIGYGGSSRNRCYSISIISNEQSKYWNLQVELTVRKPFQPTKIFTKVYTLEKER